MTFEKIFYSSGTPYGSECGLKCLPLICPCGCCCKGKAYEWEVDVKTFHVDIVEKNKQNPSEILSQSKVYFEKQIHLSRKGDGITRLLYLTTIHKESLEKSPYTRKQADTFERSVRASNATKRWLIVGGIAGVALSVVGLVGALRFWADWAGEHEGEAFSTLSVMAIGATWLSYSSTGFNPDFASNAANCWQNETAKAKEVFEKLGTCLINLKLENPELATAIAKNLSIKSLRKTAERDNRKNELDLIKPLQEAKAYVLHQKIPKETSHVKEAIERCALKNENSELKKEINALSDKLSKLEEKICRESEAT